MKPLVAILMGSKSDLETLAPAREILREFGIEHEVKVLSAHRTPDALFAYVAAAESRGTEAFIAAAGGAAHLPGVIASKTTLPVLGVPVQSKALSGQDSLLSIVQMPAGIPVGTLAIGEPGAANAGILAAQILALMDTQLAARLDTMRQEQSSSVPDAPPAT